MTERGKETEINRVRVREVLRDVAMRVVGLPGMFCFLKGVLALSPEPSEVRGISAGGNTSQAELMAPDREERG